MDREQLGKLVHQAWCDSMARIYDNHLLAPQGTVEEREKSRKDWMVMWQATSWEGLPEHWREVDRRTGEMATSLGRGRPIPGWLAFNYWCAACRENQILTQGARYPELCEVWQIGFDAIGLALGRENQRAREAP